MPRFALLFLAACGGSTPEPEPTPVADEGPGPPTPMPEIRAPLSPPEPGPERFAPVDPATLTELAVDPCNPGLAPLIAANPNRDNTMAASAGRALLGCLQANRLEDARKLADVLTPDGTLDPHAHYLVAKVLLAQRTADGNACDHEAYLDTILGHVLAAADPEQSARMQVDPTFEPVRTAYRYRWTQFPADADVLSRLGGSTWWSPGNGAYGSQARLDLRDAGTAVIATLTFPDDGGEPTWTETPTRWSFADAVLIVGEGEASVRYTLDPIGALADPDGTRAWYDRPSECEA